MFRSSRKKLNILLIVMTLIIALFISAPAAAAIDVSRSVSLSLSFTDRKTAIPGCRLYVWRVADMDENAVMTWSGSFAGMADRLDKDLTAEQWAALSTKVSEYVSSNSIAALDSGRTDENGRLTFGQVRETGVYFITGDSVVYGEWVYSPVPFMVTLPAVGADGLLHYDVESVVKYNMETNVTEEDSVPSDHSEVTHTDPPTSEVPHTDPSTDPSSDVTQTVTETVSVTGTDPSTETTGPSVPTTGSVPTEPGTSGTDTTIITSATVPTSGGVPDTTKPGKLPQTGTLAWMVPFSAAAGFGLIGAGIAIRGRKEDDGLDEKA